jgi:ABC-type nitrate/sulfonate/bicarbonate transport system permease component
MKASSRRGRAIGLALEIGVPITLLGALARRRGGGGSYYLPSVGEVLRAFNDTWLFEHVVSDALPSVSRMTVGLALAVVAGVGLGVTVGRAPRLCRAVAPVIEFLRAIPPPTLLPVGIVVIGVGDVMPTLLITFVCLFPVLLAAIDGAAALDPTLDDIIRCYQVSRRHRLCHVVLPAAAPNIFAGVRVVMPVALIMVVISEMTASSNGIGFFILHAQRNFAIPEMWSGIVLLGILGYVLNGVVLVAERRALRWRDDDQAQGER